MKKSEQLRIEADKIESETKKKKNKTMKALIITALLEETTEEEVWVRTIQREYNPTSKAMDRVKD